MTRNRDLHLEDLFSHEHVAEIPVVEDEIIVHWLCYCGQRVDFPKAAAVEEPPSSPTVLNLPTPAGYFIFHHCTETLAQVAQELLSRDGNDHQMGQALEAIVKVTRASPMNEHPQQAKERPRCSRCGDMLNATWASAGMCEPCLRK